MPEKIIPAPNVPPFVTFVTSAVPMVFDNSMSYYEALCALWKWLQDDVIDVINNNAEVTEEYIQMTKDMKDYMDNYFDNLDVQEEINNKLDAMAEDGSLEEIIREALNPEVLWTFENVAAMKASEDLQAGAFAETLGYYAKGDGGGSKYYISTSGTANEMDIIAVSSTLKAHIILEDTIDPMQFGAVGDGTTDDTTILQYILDEYTKPIKFTHYHLVDGLSTSVPRNMFSEGSNSSVGLKANNDSYVLRLIRDENNPADYRNYFIKNITISQAGTGDALLITGWGDYLMEFTIENCKIGTPYASPTGYAIHTINSLAHSVIAKNTLQGNGIYGELRDRNIITENMFFGNGFGCNLDIQSGCLNNTISKNTFSIYGKNAIYILNGEQVIIEDNQIEYPDVSDQAATHEGMIVLGAGARRCKSVQILGNNLGGGTHLNTLITLLNADDTIIDRNRLVAVNTQEIKITSSAGRTIIRDGNWGVPTASNPRSDYERKYIVLDEGVGTMGTWRSLLIQDSTTRKLEYMKTEDGLVHFKPFYIPNLVTMDLCQLPLYYRPASSVVQMAIRGDTSGEELKIRIKYDGTLTMLSAPSSQDFWSLSGAFPANRYSS